MSDEDRAALEWMATQIGVLAKDIGRIVYEQRGTQQRLTTIGAAAAHRLAKLRFVERIYIQGAKPAWRITKAGREALRDRP